MPFELMHLGTTDAMPSWLAESTLAPQLNEALQFERLLTVSASTAASCFLQAGVLRHATYLSSLTACYLFRAVWPPLLPYCPHFHRTLMCCSCRHRLPLSMRPGLHLVCACACRPLCRMSQSRPRTCGVLRAVP